MSRRPQQQEQPRTLKSDVARVWDHLSHKQQRAARLTGIAAVIAAGAAIGLLAPSGNPTPYTTPAGVVATGSSDITPFAGATITDRNIKVPTEIGLGRHELDSYQVPASELILYLGATVVPQPDGDTEVIPMPDNIRLVRPVIVTGSELANGPVTISLIDGAKLTLEQDRNPHINSVDATFSSQPGAVFPQS